MKLLKSDFNSIKTWMHRNARPLDLARWNYHFENGTKENVLTYLQAYQNQDGGFGHALEPDSWNPNSTPIQTATAIEILEEIHFADKQHLLIKQILNFLESGTDFEEGRWQNTVSSNNNYPHAPWWHTDSDSNSRREYNPTAILAGFILAFADKGSDLFSKGFNLSQELSKSFLLQLQLDMHPLLCVQHMLTYIKKAEIQNHFEYYSLCKLLDQQITHLINSDAGHWNDYGCRPTTFIKSPNNPAYKENKEIVDRELDYLLNTRNADGVWDITWKWSSFNKEFAISENWWKANVIIKNTLLLQAFRRFEA